MIKNYRFKQQIQILNIFFIDETFMVEKYKDYP